MKSLSFTQHSKTRSGKPYNTHLNYSSYRHKINANKSLTRRHLKRLNSSQSDSDLSDNKNDECMPLHSNQNNKCDFEYNTPNTLIANYKSHSNDNNSLHITAQKSNCVELTSEDLKQIELNRLRALCRLQQRKLSKAAMERSERNRKAALERLQQRRQARNIMYMDNHTTDNFVHQNVDNTQIHKQNYLNCNMHLKTPKRSQVYCPDISSTVTHNSQLLHSPYVRSQLSTSQNTSFRCPPCISETYSNLNMPSENVTTMKNEYLTPEQQIKINQSRMKALERRRKSMQT